MTKSFNQIIKEKIVILDGAMGTMLINAGLKIGEKPEMLNITSPETIVEIHTKYLKAGADIIYTNTFGANRFKLKDYPYRLAIEKGVQCAKTAVNNVKKGLIAYDMGSIGELVEPLGDVTFDQVYDAFKEQVLLVKDDVDLFVIETMSDLYELKAGVLAVKENTDKPLMVTMSFDENGRTFAGCPVEAMIATMEGMQVDALGLNCSLGPKQLKNVVDRLLEASSLPVVVKPNAGLPIIRNGVSAFNVGAVEFANDMAEFAKRGVSILGGCCGTTDEYISKLAKKLEDVKPIEVSKKNKVWVASGTKCVELNSPKIIGERINPTGKAIMKKAIADKDTSYFQQQAVEQTQAGADILDINMGIPNINEAEMVTLAVKSVQAVQDCPLQIDSSDFNAVEAGLRYVNGKAIVNSVNGDKEIMERIFPLAKKYGALVVGLTLDRNGVPKTVEKRLEIAKRIVETAKKFGLKEQDLIIDCLTLTVGAEQAQAQNTLLAMREIKKLYNVKTVLGISNISFGLPERQIVNSSFLTLALSNGLDLAIVNPNLDSIKQSFMAFNLLYGYDASGESFIKHFSGKESISNKVVANSTSSLKDSIISNLKCESEEKTRQMLTEKDGLEIIDSEIIPALDYIGEQYEKGTLFLPQLISSAEIAKSVCDIIKQSMPAEQSKEKAKIVLATVEGDVHDIGKNIVKTVLQNYGYEIIDLGRDVKVEKVVETVKKQKPQVVGLSALMTTTVKNMQRTIDEIRKVDSKVLICVGGAVLTCDVAKDIGADAYSRDPRQLVKFLQSRNL